MIDVIYSSDSNALPRLEQALRAFRTDPSLPQRGWSGKWGSLAAIGSAYAGFLPVETAKHICVVLGGPLPRHDESVACGDKSDDGTTWILERWLGAGSIQWDVDLVGHFLVVLVDKRSTTVNVVTDINSFVPACVVQDGASGACMMGSHADALALAAGVQSDIDAASAVDLQVYHSVTHPFTLYRPVQQLPAASVTSLLPGGHPTVSTYWAPREEPCTLTLDEAARVLRDTITANVERICVGQNEVGMLLSGGEDSRIIASLVPHGTHVQAVTFVDTFNHEAQVAQAVAHELGLTWVCAERAPMHYVVHAQESVRLTESHHLFLHAHVNGLSHRLPAGRRCLGAFYADALFKACWATSYGRYGVSLGVHHDRVKTRSRDVALPRFDACLANAVRARRDHVEAAMRLLRPRTWAEFTSFMPAPANSGGFPHAAAARRLCYMYEPYLDAEVVKLAAAVRQEWKLNRRFYRRAMNPTLLRTRHIPHANGTLPSAGIAVNTLLRATRSAATHLHRGRPDTEDGSSDGAVSRGSWPDWTNVVRSHTFHDAYQTARATASTHQCQLDMLLPTASLTDAASTVDAVSQLASFQVLLWLNDCHRGMLTADD